MPALAHAVRSRGTVLAADLVAVARAALADGREGSFARSLPLVALWSMCRWAVGSVYVQVGGGLSTYANGRGLQQNLAAELLRVEEDEDLVVCGAARPGRAAARGWLSPRV